MKQFLDDNFLLNNESSIRLYHEYAKELPLIDYHCHLPPESIARDLQFDNLTQVWLNGDHYKWRAMRANGVDEKYITGSATDQEKFRKWAATVPYTLRNPLYHWTHLELKRYFGINELLNAASADAIYEACAEKLRTPAYSVKGLLRKMNVQVICTTDDPADSLEFHKQLAEEGFEIPVLPAFRPDNVLNVSNPSVFNAYTKRLEMVTNKTITTFKAYLSALHDRHDFFASMGCCVSDQGLEEMYADDFTEKELSLLFAKIHSGKELNHAEQRKFKSGMLIYFAQWNHEKGWVQQFHLGALRNNNSRRLQDLGPDTGWDSIGDFSQAKSLSAFMDRLDRNNQLTKTILYNLNPADNEMMAAMTGNFNDGTVEGKIQYGSAWWFLDQKDGMTRQINALSHMGLLSKFIGMLTDSRSFMSYPRHEYFRRILCNLFGEEVERGELPNDIPWIGKLVSDICYHNARNYFNWPASVK